MTQLVFVHGVATRSGDGYDQTVHNRNALLADILFKDQQLTIHTPLWGNHVAKIDGKVFETGKVAQSFSLTLGASLGMGGGIGMARAPGASSDEELSAAGLSRTDAVAALDAVFVELLDEYERQGETIPAADLAIFMRAAEAISADIEAGDSQIPPDGTAALLGSRENDLKLREALSAVSRSPASYGIGSALGNAISAVTDRIRNVASRAAVDPLVDWVRPAIGFFLGDVFAYLHNDDRREKIRTEVRNSLLAAQAARETGEKLVVIGHSLGGVILLDMLCNPDDAGIPNDLAIDALFTVGSQPGLFQALSLFAKPTGNKIPKPVNVAHWFNVFDPIDPLAFRCDPIFSDVKDLKFNSITGVASAHTTYFKRPQFHARARKRLSEIGVIA